MWGAKTRVARFDLGERFRILKATGGSTSGRHRSLEAALDWSSARLVAILAVVALVAALTGNGGWS